MKSFRPYICLAMFLFLFFQKETAFLPVYGDTAWGTTYTDYESEIVNIKNVNGKFYAYIVLLFNENPHFVNLIQKDSIPAKLMSSDGFHLNAYRAYLKSLAGSPMENLASTMLNIYLDPNYYSEAQLLYLEEVLTRYNIIVKFSKNANLSNQRIVLDYCIYGKKTLITVKHPFIEIPYKIYNIRPYIYYDEFSTTSSTFYYDMIYISMDEVINDSIIAAHVLSGKTVNTLFFVGSRVTDDIKFCLKKAFSNKSNIRKEIWETFVIHELTHKMINNRYNYYDQVNGEELSLVSTMYVRPYLGLSVMYSYLNYNSINPHRIAASNFVRYVADKSGKKEITQKPGLLKHLPENQIKQYAKDYFVFIEDKLK